MEKKQRSAVSTAPLLTRKNGNWQKKSLKMRNMHKDPVCGVTVDEKTAKFKSLYELNVFYFDSEKCKAEFDRNPQKYVNELDMQYHASHYRGYCPTPGCGRPQRGAALYFYIGLLILLVAALLLYSFSRLLI